MTVSQTDASADREDAALEAATDQPHLVADDGQLALSESDGAETRMIYDRGTLPWFLGVVWVCALVGFGIYIARYLVPSLVSWGAP